MKATGIVRRVDDLGRVVIPKEIRRTLNIKDGDALEIFTEDRSVIFQKYKAHEEEVAEQCGEIVNDIVKRDILYNVSVSGKNVTVCTSRGRATATCMEGDTFNLNVGIVVALSKLGHCALPEGI